ncbi:MAG: hypothetical protein HKO93_05635, partial [Flavobacteriales bacterium]|nr:hypothetical protein [Flavobacteriales bacterium]
MKDFIANGQLDSELGSANAMMNVDIAQDPNFNSYKGSMALEGLDLGRLLNDPEFGSIDSDLEIDMKGYGRGLSAFLKGEISQLEYRGYSYKNVEVDGRLEDRLFNGFLSISQPEVDLDFRGLVDMKTSVPEFKFEAKVFQADIARLGFASQMDSTSMTGSVQADFKGDDIDDFEGSLKAQGLSFCRGEEEYFFSTISLLSQFDKNGNRILDLNSNMLDGRFEGEVRFKDLKGDFVTLFENVFPSLYKEVEIPVTHNSNLTFEVDFKETKDLTRLFFPGLEISYGATLIGGINAQENTFKLNFNTDSLNYDFIAIQGMDLELNRFQNIAYALLETEFMQWSDSLRFKDNLYTFNAYNDSIETDLTWTLVDKDVSGSISMLSQVFTIDSIMNILYPSQMVMSGDYWLTDGFSEILYKDGGIYIDRAIVSNGKERVSIFGSIAASKESRLDFDVEGFKLEHINKFLPKDMVTFDGVTSLKGHGTSLLGKPTIVAEMEIRDFAIAQERIGNLQLSSTWDRGQEFLRLAGQLENQGINEIEAEGKFFPSAEKDDLEAQLTFNGFYLDVLNKLPTGGISHLGGQATGNLDVKGSLLEPDINGELSFKDATLQVNYLNTTYFFNDKVVVRNNYIGTNHIPFTDEYGNTGFLNGTVAHENYRDWNYDIYAEFSKLMVLNTDATMNDTFYGKVFGTGSVSLFGFDRNLTIEIFGRTEAGTIIELPLGSSSDIVLDDFVYFKSDLSKKEEVVDERPPTTIELFMEAETTPDAEIKLIFDEKIGDVMKGRGQGTLTMTLDRAGTFEIFGNYLITEGDYLFTLQNVVNKRFTVETGSMVSFYGDPY